MKGVPLHEQGMVILMEIFSNYPLICGIIGWLSAQICKVIIGMFHHKKFSFTLFLSSGGMPSSHTATMLAVTVAIARIHGLASTYFALAFVVSFIVMYDAAGVRLQAGKQAAILNKIIKDLEDGETKYMQKDLKELIGHTPVQVFAGAALGIVIPFLVPVC